MMHTSGIADHGCPTCNIFCNYRARADNSAVANMHTAQYNRPAANPDIGADFNWARNFKACPAFTGIFMVLRTVDLHVGPQHG